MNKAMKVAVFAVPVVLSTLAFGETIAQARDKATTFRVVYVSEIGSDSQRTQLLASAT